LELDERQFCRELRVKLTNAESCIDAAEAKMALKEKVREPENLV